MLENFNVNKGKTFFFGNTRIFFCGFTKTFCNKPAFVVHLTEDELDQLPENLSEEEKRGFIVKKDLGMALCKRHITTIIRRQFGDIE